ncbi:CAunnamed protein product [Biomphalaria glabrata]|nr:CAunnamed protein product [Biomphalaria glabrata]
MELKAAVKSVPKNKKDFQVVINADMKHYGEDRGRFNVPTCNEVASLIVGQVFEKVVIISHWSVRMSAL